MIRERYEAYKDSGVEWIGEIPESWAVQRFRWTLKRVNRQPLESDEIVTCFRDGEVTLRKNRREDGFTMSDKEVGYQHICAGDFVIHGMDGFAGAMGISDSDGKASPVLMAFHPIGAHDLRYINYLLRLYAWRNVFLALSTTIRVRSCDLNWAKIAPLPLLLPNFKEQQVIADYLDAKTAEIDGLVADCEREVELLREYRKAVISEAVTKGLDPNAPMKDSGVEWIGEIPCHWDAGKLLRHARLESGHTPSRLHPEWWIEDECSIPWITTQDVHRFRDGRITSINDTVLHVSQIGLDNSSARLLPAGTVALSRTASVGFSIVLSVSMASSQDFADWVPDESLDSFYLLYSLRSMDRVFGQLQMGSTHKTIYMPDIMKLSVAFPPIDEQRAIVTHLDAKTAEIDSLIEAKQSMADKLREYRKSLISEAVTGKFKVPGI